MKACTFTYAGGKKSKAQIYNAKKKKIESETKKQKDQ